MLIIKLCPNIVTKKHTHTHTFNNKLYKSPINLINKNKHFTTNHNYTKLLGIINNKLDNTNNHSRKNDLKNSNKNKQIQLLYKYSVNENTNINNNTNCVISKKILIDIFIDSCCISIKNIIFNNIFFNTSSISIFIACIFNNFFLNKFSLKSLNFFQRSYRLLNFGILSNSISAYVYVNPFNLIMYCKYVFIMASGMAILSNPRYTILRKIEAHTDNIYHTFIFRIINNIFGIIQQSLIITYLL